MERKALLGQISFGSQVAEDERRELARYFVETDQWKRIFGGEVDIVRGEKWSGKSAIYSLLTERDAELFDNRVLISSAENPRGIRYLEILLQTLQTVRLSLLIYGNCMYCALWQK
jgi:hypothetical protein